MPAHIFSSSGSGSKISHSNPPKTFSQNWGLHTVVSVSRYENECRHLRKLYKLAISGWYHKQTFYFSQQEVGLYRCFTHAAHVKSDLWHYGWNCNQISWISCGESERHFYFQDRTHKTNRPRILYKQMETHLLQRSGQRVFWQIHFWVEIRLKN